MTQQTNSRQADLTPQPWALWWLQAKRLTQIELRRNLFSWKASWIYFLAFVPTVIVGIHGMFDAHDPSSLHDDTQVLAGIIQLYYVRLGVFFGCLGIFSRLIRGEMIERSLHFYLLTPVRREILLLSKFAAGSATALLLFVTATFADFALMYLPYGTAGRDYLVNGPGLEQLEAYVLIITLACLGYGAVFLLLSMMFKNPVLGALIFLGWEAINPVLPSLLQKLSVASYLRHLMPVNVGTKGLIALLTVETEPVSGWIATLGLLLLITVVLLYSCYRIRTLEIRYTTE